MTALRWPRKRRFETTLPKLRERQRKDDIAPVQRSSSSSVEIGAWCTDEGSGPWADWPDIDAFETFHFTYELVNTDPGIFYVNPSAPWKMKLQADGWYRSLWMGNLFTNGAIGSVYVRQTSFRSGGGSHGPENGLGGASPVFLADGSGSFPGGFGDTSFSPVVVVGDGPAVAGTEVSLEVAADVDDLSLIQIERARFSIVRLAGLPDIGDSTSPPGNHWQFPY